MLYKYIKFFIRCEIGDKTLVLSPEDLKTLKKYAYLSFQTGRGFIPN